MATWKELYDLMIGERLSADQLIDRLKVKPSRLRQRLRSPRLRARLDLAGAVARTAAGLGLPATDAPQPPERRRAEP